MTDTPAKPRRRWLSFSLRTMFVVVTAFACWLGYSLNWIRQRHAYLDEVQRRSDDTHWSVVRSTDFILDYGPMPDAPFPLRIFGEVAIAEVRANDPEQFARAKRLFPEAYIGIPGIVVWPPKPEAAPATQADRP